MSEQTTEPATVELPAHGDAAFASLMDALAPDKEAGAASQGQGQTGTLDQPGGGAAAAGAGTGTGTAPAGGGDTPGAPVAGDGTGAGDPGTGGAPGAGGAAAGDAGAAGAGAAAEPVGGDLPATWTASAAEFAPKLEQLSQTIEEKHTQAFQAEALEEVQKEHSAYFEVLEQPPRTLVGTQVPSLTGEGMETLSSSEDAKDWQDTVKQILVEEVRDRATRAMEESGDFLDTVHASIEIFQKNTDLIPGTKEFDVELANRFATLATPYELRVEDKLQGYSIPVQPIIEQLRAQLVKERADKPAAGAGGVETPGAAASQEGAGGSSPNPPAPTAPPAAADAPQAGIPSKAGNSSEKDDFSVLFGTIGLPNLQI